MFQSFAEVLFAAKNKTEGKEGTSQKWKKSLLQGLSEKIQIGCTKNGEQQNCRVDQKE